MKTQTSHPLRRTVFVLAIVLVLGLSIRAGQSLAATAKKSKAPAAPAISATAHIAEQEDNRIRTCKEAGLCVQGKKRLMLDSKKAKDLLPALQQGCHAKKWLEDGVTLECPDAALVPAGRTERVFKTQDVFANTQIGATAVQNRGDRGSGVKVAVLDTGIDANHPEFSTRILAQASFIAEGTTNDVIGHGTHVAGIIAGQGVQPVTDPQGANRALGVAPGVQLLIGKVCNDQGYCMEGDITAGIEWAVNQGAKVINMSLGGGAFLNHCDADPLAAKANWAADQGVTVVAAAGNGAETTPGTATPACGSKVIAVGAVDSNNVRPVWSGNGNALDVMALGLNVLSALPCSVANSCPEAGYGWWSGTSMAAPSVSGAAALLLGIIPTLTPQQVATALTQTAYDLGSPGPDTSYGAGRVNVDAASAQILDRDYDGSPIPADCNDNDPTIRPGNIERCDNTVDDNCDGVINEGCTPSSSSVSSVPAVPPPVCGNGILETGEECESNADCVIGTVCTDCRCIALPSSSSVSSPSSGGSSSQQSQSTSSSSSRSSSSPRRTECDELRSDFGEKMKDYWQTTPITDTVSYLCQNRDDMQHRYDEIKSVRDEYMRHNCGILPLPPQPPPFCQTCPEGIQSLFKNKLEDYTHQRCKDWSHADFFDRQNFESLTRLLQTIIDTHPSCQFALPVFPACPPFSSSSSDNGNNEDDHRDGRGASFSSVRSFPSMNVGGGAPNTGSHREQND